MVFDGLEQKRARRRMKDPVRGVFRTTSSYPGVVQGLSAFDNYTGVVTAPGLPATAVKYEDGLSGRLAKIEARVSPGKIEYPVLVDRADPYRFVILWNEIPRLPSEKEKALSRAQAAAERLNATGDGRIDAERGAESRGAPAAPPGEYPYFEIGQDQFMVVATPDAVIALGEAERLRDASEPADAVVTGARAATPPPGEPAPAGWLLDVALQITKSDGSSYSTVMRFPVDTSGRDVLSAAGTRFTVRIDPANPGVLAVAVPLEAARTSTPVTLPAFIRIPGAAADQFVVVGVPGAEATMGEVTGLQQAWEEADAVVTSAAEAVPPLGLPSPAAGIFDITLLVTKADGVSYSTVRRMFVATSESRAQLSTAGNRFKVRIDPANPALLAIDRASLPAVGG